MTSEPRCPAELHPAPLLDPDWDSMTPADYTIALIERQLAKETTE
jgi:hypothetical protein